MNYKILLSGAGQLGSRYLQGLFEFPDSLTIFVHDINNDALKKCQAFCESLPKSTSHHLFYTNNFNDLPGQIDLVIVSSTANARATIVQSIVNVTKVKYWILEKVLTQTIADLHIVGNKITDKEHAWVNTARRSWNFYSTIKELLNKEGAKNFSISGQFGLACNAIHFIDIFAWLTSEKLVSIDASMLDHSWSKSKREGFWEVTGALNVNYSRGSKLVLTSDSSLKEFTMILQDKDRTWSIDENTGLAKCSNGIEISDIIPMQSQATASIVSDIFNTGSCKLTPLCVSIEMHEFYLNAFQAHWNSYSNNGIQVVQIT